MSVKCVTLVAQFIHGTKLLSERLRKHAITFWIYQMIKRSWVLQGEVGTIWNMAIQTMEAWRASSVILGKIIFGGGKLPQSATFNVFRIKSKWIDAQFCFDVLQVFNLLNFSFYFFRKRRYHTRRIQRDVLKTKKPLIGDSMGHTPPYTHRHSGTSHIYKQAETALMDFLCLTHWWICLFIQFCHFVNQSQNMDGSFSLSTPLNWP